MTKLEAWNTWLMMTHSDTSGDVFTLNHSITGKAFSFGACSHDGIKII